ncbi:hypothetical protein VKT23_018549 [Stygiomarasmius scandens]|uniref:Uncharacterized protein n=1 Tax=Marasmiellus scandens TaxID=2682957 RepID=A0ABR1INP8_9AGAR
MSNPFIDTEAVDDRLDRGEEEEEEEEHGFFDDSDEFIDEEMVQDLDQLHMLEDMPHHTRFQEWSNTLSSIAEKYERAPSASSTFSCFPSQHPNLSELDTLRVKMNQVPDSQLHTTLRSDDSASFWRLKCKPNAQYTLLRDILLFKPTSPIPSPEHIWIPTLLRSSISAESKSTSGSDSRSRAWSAVANYVTSGQSIPQIHAELETILGEQYVASDWDAVITASTAEGDDEASIMAAQAEVVKLAAAAGYPIAPVSPNNAAFDGAPPASSSASSTSLAVATPVQALPMLSPSSFPQVSANDRDRTPLFLPDPSPTPSIIPLPLVEKMFMEMFAASSSSTIPSGDPVSSNADPLSTIPSWDAVSTDLNAYRAEPSSSNTGPNPPLNNLDDEDNTLSSLHLPNSPIRAAFCVPHVIDCIYLEAEPFFHPDAAKYSSIMTYLRQHSAVQ